MANVQTARKITDVGTNGQNGELSAALHKTETLETVEFPRLENFLMTLRKNPYAAIGAMIGVASIIVVALTTVSVAMFTAIILLYGQVRENNAMMTTALHELSSVKASQVDDGKVVRTYEAARDKQIGFIVGVMTAQQREAFLEFQKANPIPPATKERNE